MSLHIAAFIFLSILWVLGHLLQPRQLGLDGRPAGDKLALTDKGG